MKNLNEACKVFKAFLLVAAGVLSSCSGLHELTLVKRSSHESNEISKSAAKQKLNSVDQLSVNLIPKADAVASPIKSIPNIQKIIAAKKNKQRLIAFVPKRIEKTAGNLTASNSKLDNHITRQEAMIAARINEMDETYSTSSSTSSGNSRLLYVIICILLPPLAVFLFQNAITSDFWIDLLLTLLFYIPGLIYGLWIILK